MKLLKISMFHRWCYHFGISSSKIHDFHLLNLIFFLRKHPSSNSRFFHILKNRLNKIWSKIPIKAIIHTCYQLFTMLVLLLHRLHYKTRVLWPTMKSFIDQFKVRWIFEGLRNCFIWTLLSLPLRSLSQRRWKFTVLDWIWGKVSFVCCLCFTFVFDVFLTIKNL